MHRATHRPDSPHLIKNPCRCRPEARTIQRVIVGLLERLKAQEVDGSLDGRFQEQWTALLAEVDRYQAAITAGAGKIVRCAAGCSRCCDHWVEDVNSFEAERIAAYLKKKLPGRIPAIVDQCRRDNAALERLNSIVEARLAAFDDADEAKKIDAVDLLLASFFRLHRPCPLLDRGQHVCMVYHVRPLTCRMYVSFSDPSRCEPQNTDDDDIPTYLFDLEENADAIIDALHFKFMRFEGDTGLRSLVPRSLADYRE